jgi:hypothetical protein
LRSSCGRNHADEAREVSADERRVLERAEQGEEERDGESERELAAPPLDQLFADEADERRRSHEQRKPPLRVRIEHVARDDDQNKAGAKRRDREVRHDDERQEDEQEDEAVEEHALQLLGVADFRNRLADEFDRPALAVERPTLGLVEPLRPRIAVQRPEDDRTTAELA